MLSKTPHALETFEATNRAWEAPVAAFLTALCGDKERHARFLNTLSQMEHVGSRKIMMSQAKGELPQDTLKHLAEETRHAFFFKRAAEKLAGRTLDYGTEATLGGNAARMYMGRLDAFIADELGSRAPSETAYLYMSLIVELRAIWFYRTYQAALTAAKHPLSLKSVLAEEELHLEEMLARLDAIDPALDAHIIRFSAYENARFPVLWGEIAGGN
jgi:hypothetical protein